MRGIQNALSDVSQASSCALAAALLTVSMLDWKLGLADCTALYQRILRSTWTLERYQRDLATVRLGLESLFSIPDMHDGSSCCQEAHNPLGLGNIEWITGVFGFALIKGCSMSELEALH